MSLKKPRLREDSDTISMRYNFMMVDYAPVYKDLALDGYDLEHVYPELQIAMPFLDGSSLCLYSEVEKSCDSI